MKKLILAALMVLSVGVSQNALADDQPVVATNNSYDVVQFELVRDGQVLDQCVMYEQMRCLLSGEILSGHFNEVVVRDQNRDVIGSVQIQDARQQVTLNSDHTISVNYGLRR